MFHCKFAPDHSVICDTDDVDFELCLMFEALVDEILDLDKQSEMTTIELPAWEFLFYAGSTVGAQETVVSFQRYSLDIVLVEHFG